MLISIVVLFIFVILFISIMLFVKGRKDSILENENKNLKKKLYFSLERGQFLEYIIEKGDFSSLLQRLEKKKAQPHWSAGCAINVCDAGFWEGTQESGGYVNGNPCPICGESNSLSISETTSWGTSHEEKVYHYLNTPQKK